MPTGSNSSHHNFSYILKIPTDLISIKLSSKYDRDFFAQHFTFLMQQPRQIIFQFSSLQRLALNNKNVIPFNHPVHLRMNILGHFRRRHLLNLNLRGIAINNSKQSLHVTFGEMQYIPKSQLHFTRTIFKEIYKIVIFINLKKS